jgi:hypothetical protein
MLTTCSNMARVAADRAGNSVGGAAIAAEDEASSNAVINERMKISLICAGE